MDYEKAYKEARNKLQEVLSQTDGHEISGRTRRCIEEIFPELKESEEERDERIRKEIISIVKSYRESCITEGNHRFEECLAWLEKQGEQKGSAKEAPPSGALSFINYLDAHRYIGKMCVSNGECEDIVDAFHNGMWDKLHRYYCKYIEKQDDESNDEQDSTDIMKQEFKEGDWIVVGDMVGQISGVQEDCYIGRDTDGWYFSLSRPEGNSNAHLWTIEDAKEGDVLVWDDNKCIALFKNIDDEESFISYGCVGHCTGVFESGESYHDIEGVYPATKEQRDLLFQKLKDAGYEWDSQNNSLSKI